MIINNRNDDTQIIKIKDSATIRYANKELRYNVAENRFSDLIVGDSQISVYKDDGISINIKDIYQLAKGIEKNTPYAYRMSNELGAIQGLLKNGELLQLDANGEITIQEQEVNDFLNRFVSDVVSHYRNVAEAMVKKYNPTAPFAPYRKDIDALLKDTSEFHKDFGLSDEVRFRIKPASAADCASS